MKKLTILTSLFALSACGGGGSGGSAPVQPVVSPTDYVEIRDSNANVTGMVANSKYQVARYIESELNNFDTVSTDASRSATSRSPFQSNNNGHHDKDDEYIELVDIAAWLVNSETTKEEIVALYNQDWRKIQNALKLIKDSYCFVGNHPEETAERIINRRTRLQEPLENLLSNTEIFDLSNVEFTMAAASAGHGDEGGSKDVFKFELNSKGEISGIKHTAYIIRNGRLEKDETATAVFSRNNRTNTFDVGQLNGEGKVYTGTGTVITYGRDIGLKYSDFGQFKYDLHYVQGNESGDEKSYEPFAGGYEELRHDTPGTDMNFSGRAAGSVSSGDTDKNITGPATLAFNNGTETLNMYFSGTVATSDDIPWYDVTIVRNDNTNSITFTKNESSNSIPASLQFDGFNGNTKTVTDYLVDGYNGAGYDTQRDGNGKLDIGYYGGRNSGVTEATGVTQYVGHGTAEHEIRMNVGFGMTKDN